jgi:hypothetical protein
MANPLTVTNSRQRRTPSPSFSSRSSRRSGTDTRLGAAARCLVEMLHEPSSLGTRRRTAGFARGVERIRAGLMPILSPEALLDSYDREAVRSDLVEAAYALRWLELSSGEVRPSWRALTLLN